MTGFANVEEDYADNAVWSMNLLPRDKHVSPWRIEDELKKLGANYVQAGLWRGFAVRDGNLITGQQQFSGSETADAVIRALGELSVGQTLIHTGQHYDARMSDVFFADLGLPEPDVNLHVSSGAHGEQTAAVIAGVM